MAERIELPPMLQGDEKAQLKQLWSYLYQMSEALNNNLQAIGGNELTDSDRQVMNKILGEAGEKAMASGEMETLKSLIIKTADFVQTSLQEYRLNLLGESVASGQFGRYVRHTGLDVAVTPEGITQNYSFEEVVQGLKEFSINAKNYIKTGLLRTVGSLPVYGVAIGKDVVTFSEDGTETYHDGNKVAELTAEELSFWQNSVKIASYKGTEIILYSGSSKRIGIDANGVKIYNGNTVVAEMLGTAVKIYANGALRTQADAEGLKIYDGSTLLAKYTGSGTEIYQNGTMVTKYAASRIGFYSNGSEMFYINNGKIYCNGDMEIGANKTLTIKAGNDSWTFDSTGMKYEDSNSPLPFQIARYDEREYLASGLFMEYGQGSGKIVLLAECGNNAHTSPSGYWRGELCMEMVDEADYTNPDTGEVIQGNRVRLYPRAHPMDIGKADAPVSNIVTGVISGKYYDSADLGQMMISPDPRDAKRYKGIAIQEKTENNQEVVMLFKGSEVDEFRITADKFYGTLDGCYLIKGSTYIKIQPNRASGKENVAFFIGEEIENNKQTLKLYKASGVEQFVVFADSLYVDTIYVDSNGTLKQIGTLANPFTNGYIKNLRKVDVITVDSNGTYKQIGEPGNAFSSGYIAYLREVDWIVPDQNGSLKRIGDTGKPFTSAYITNLREVDWIVPDQNGTLKRIGDVGKPFSSAYITNLREVDWIVPDQNGTVKQIGDITKPFNEVHTKLLYGGIACRSTTETDYNNLVTDGRYWVNANAMANGPSTLTAGVAELEVVSVSTNYIRQRLYTRYRFFTRERYNGTWSSWYEFTGTAV